MKRPGYREAIRWILDNDDTDFLDRVDGIESVTASLVADLRRRREQDRVWRGEAP